MSETATCLCESFCINYEGEQYSQDRVVPPSEIRLNPFGSEDSVNQSPAESAGDLGLADTLWTTTDYQSKHLAHELTRSLVSALKTASRTLRESTLRAQSAQDCIGALSIAANYSIQTYRRSNHSMR